MSCPTCGFPTVRHNEVSDLFAAMFTEVCHDVEIEPVLQPLSREICYCNDVTQDEARLHISACGFWGGRFQKLFFDIKMFNPSALFI